MVGGGHPGNRLSQGPTSRVVTRGKYLRENGCGGSGAQHPSRPLWGPWRTHSLHKLPGVPPPLTGSKRHTCSARDTCTCGHPVRSELGRTAAGVGPRVSLTPLSRDPASSLQSLRGPGQDTRPAAQNKLFLRSEDNCLPLETRVHTVLQAVPSGPGGAEIRNTKDPARPVEAGRGRGYEPRERAPGSGPQQDRPQNH